jgi:hypothetical protein
MDAKFCCPSQPAILLTRRFSGVIDDRSRNTTISTVFRAAKPLKRLPTLRQLVSTPLKRGVNKSTPFVVVLIAALTLTAATAAEWVTYTGQSGLGNGKQIVLLSGDEEYRSEESMPMLAKILAVRHGFKCTVLFAINPATGMIDPVTLTNIPGMAALDTADLCVMALRFRELPDDQMKHFVDYLNRGKPIVALRTSTHAFKYERKSPFDKYDYRNQSWPGGFGQQVLGETWVNHHGNHGKESTRAVPNEAFKNNPILLGVSDAWCPTDVYTVSHLPSDAQVLLLGQVLSGMAATSPPVEGPKNNPMMPVAWIRQYTGEGGKPSKIFCTTIGAAVDLQNEGLRRLLVNACYWAMGMEVPSHANVDYVGDYQPTWFGFGQYKKGMRPDDFKMPN